MSHGFTARATWALRVPPGELLVPADMDLAFPVSIKVSMAALDPTEEPIIEEGETVPRIPRSTLKMVRLPPLVDESDDEDDLTSEQLEELKALIAANADDEDDDEDEEEAPKAGPSSKKSKKGNSGVKKLTQALKGTAEDSDEEMAEAGTRKGTKPNGIKKGKGKGKVTEEVDDESDSEFEDSDLEDGEPDTPVICTLDTERNYQQPLELILPAEENIGFIVTGTHTVYLTGNLVTHFEEEEDSGEEGEDSDEEDYDLEPDSDELMGDSDEESDILDGQRITEVDSDEDDEAPKLVSSTPAKPSKKRPAEEEAENLDDMMKAEEKMSKKQLKKMKTNKGEAVATKDAKAETKKTSKAEKAEKKVQFAKNLEQGPTGSEANKATEKKVASSVTVVKGVKIDDRKAGQGRKSKAGDRVGMRYIGKLENGKVFDANKKGPPFSFKLGSGEVIKGWDIGIAGMAVGGERRLTIPANLAYGSRGVPGIPGNSTLIFDVKLLEIK